jgi:hypothetical protein
VRELLVAPGDGCLNSPASAPALARVLCRGLREGRPRFSVAAIGRGGLWEDAAIERACPVAAKSDPHAVTQQFNSFLKLARRFALDECAGWRDTRGRAGSRPRSQRRSASRSTGGSWSSAWRRLAERSLAACLRQIEDCPRRPRRGSRGFDRFLQKGTAGLGERLCVR